MVRLRILISGGGIAGPALALWLSKLDHDITIVERFHGLRDAGQQIDLRGQGVQVMKMMGIEREVRAKVVDEQGARFVNSDGVCKAFISPNKTGKGKQSATSEFEIMRGDLCRILYDRTKDKVKYIFGTSITSFQQSDTSVNVQFSDGTEGHFDLLVGADGQNSRTRRMLLGPDAPDALKSLGIYMSYYTIPQQQGDENVVTICHAAGGRVMATRRDNPRTLQVYLMTTSNAERIESALKESAAEQQDAFAETFRGSGWQSERILEGMRSAEDFYAQVIGQVKMDSWSQGRVVLLGDAAFCPSPITGMGTSSALVGAYVLAGEIAKNCQDSSTDGILVALKEYESRLRPFIEKAQAMSPWYPRIACPESQWVIWLIHTIIWLVTTLRLDKLGSMLLSDDVGGWEVPRYTEFNAQE